MSRTKAAMMVEMDRELMAAKEMIASYQEQLHETEDKLDEAMRSSRRPKVEIVDSASRTEAERLRESLRVATDREHRARAQHGDCRELMIKQDSEWRLKYSNLDKMIRMDIVPADAIESAMLSEMAVLVEGGL